MAAETQILIGLGIGIVCLIFMIMKTKIHTFLALILATVLVGVIGGIEFKQIVASITKGFGGTLGSIGIIIGFGVMMGQLFEVSGAAKRMALCFLKLFGKGREEIAMALTGFLVSIPIFHRCRTRNRSRHYAYYGTADNRACGGCGYFRSQCRLFDSLGTRTRCADAHRSFALCKVGGRADLADSNCGWWLDA